jgi:hypothetical protein
MLSQPPQNKPKFNIVEFFVVNIICVRLFAVENYYAIECLHLNRHGGTCKFGFEFYWDVKHLFLLNLTFFLIKNFTSLSETSELVKLKCANVCNSYFNNNLR